MQGQRKHFAAGLAVAALGSLGLTAALAGPPGPDVKTFRTTRPPQLVATKAGVRIDPILSVSDLIGAGTGGSTLGAYQMSGSPDGLGAFKSSNGTVDVLMNHELAGFPDGARVTQLTLDGRRNVLDARYVIRGSEGYRRFCSSSLSVIDGVAWYTTGEEASPGRSIAINAQTGQFVETNHFGYFQHENVIHARGLEFGMFISTEDGAQDTSQLYAYTATTPQDALEGNGQLWVWTSDDAGDGDPSSDEIAKGQTLNGRFIPLSAADNANAATLEAAAQAKGAFDFTRLEDIAQSKTDSSLFWFVDTGSSGAQTQRGRMYTMQVDRNFDPAAVNLGDPSTYPMANVKVILDGDLPHDDDIVNPDNIDTSPSKVVITEDRGGGNQFPSVKGGFGRVLVYDIKRDTITSVARVATPPSLPPGSWESSGVLNASSLLGRNWWLIDVQASGVSQPQPGPSLVPNSSSGGDGQLLAIRIPGSTGWGEEDSD